MGVLEAQFRHLGVHGRHAARNGAIPEIFGQQVGAIVGAGHHGGIEGIRQGHMLPLLQGNVAGIRPREGIDILVGHFQAHTVPLALSIFCWASTRPVSASMMHYASVADSAGPAARAMGANTAQTQSSTVQSTAICFFIWYTP